MEGMPSQLGLGGRVFPEGPCSWQGDLTELLPGLQMKVTKLHIPEASDSNGIP